MSKRPPKRLAVLITFAGLTALAALAVFGARALMGGDSPAAETVTSTFHVTGMTCGGCEFGVRHVVKKLDGVAEVEASYKEERVVVTYQPEKVKPEQIIQAIESLGYSAEPQEEEEDAEG